jgi:hypothetical protein
MTSTLPELSVLAPVLALVLALASVLAKVPA